MGGSICNSDPWLTNSIVMKKVLVTGATGFIGNYLIQLLLAKGYQVIATSSNLFTAEKKPWFSKVQFIELDFNKMQDEVNYFEYFDNPDFLFHLAWEGLPNYNDEFHVKENLPKHVRFLSNLIKNGLKDLLVTGTCFEYGLIEGCLDETLDTKPITQYGIAKDELCKYLQSLSKEKNVQFKWARLFYIFGEGQNEHSLYAQLKKAIREKQNVFNMSGGEQIRDFLEINKVVELLCSIGLQDKMNGVFNCCSGNPIKVLNFVNNIIKKEEAQIDLNVGYYPYSVYEPFHFWGATKKIALLH